MISPTPGVGRWCLSRCWAPLLLRFLALGARLPRLVLLRRRWRPLSADWPLGSAEPAPAGTDWTSGSRLTGSRSPGPAASPCAACREGRGGRVAGVAVSTNARITVSSTNSRRRSRCLGRVRKLLMMRVIMAPAAGRGYTVTKITTEMAGRRHVTSHPSRPQHSHGSAALDIHIHCHTDCHAHAHAFSTRMHLSNTAQLSPVERQRGLGVGRANIFLPSGKSKQT